MRFVHIANLFMASAHGGEAPNPGDVVMEHLSDSAITSGPIGYINQHFFNEKLFGIFDMRITTAVAMMWLAIALCLLIFIPLARRVKKADRGSTSRWVNMWEILIDYIRKEVVFPNFHGNTSKVLPYFLTLFFFILFCNLLGIIPSLKTATGNLAVTGALAVLTLVEMMAVGFIKHGPAWIITGIVPHGLPKGIYLIMWPIELIGLFMKPIVLMIRLFANMLAGHIVIIVFVMLIIMFENYFVAFGSVPGVVFIDALELLVALIQAYVFTMLTAIFVSSCMESH